MKKIAVTLIILCSLINVTSLAYAGEYDDLERYGFHLVADTKEKLHLKLLRIKNTYIVISKQRFKNSNDAAQFCLNQNVPSADLTIALFLAMSGVAMSHQFIFDSISFNFSKENDEDRISGIWVWSKAAEDTVIMMFDGRGTETMEASIFDINAQFNQDVSLPAVCSNFTMKALPHIEMH